MDEFALDYVPVEPFSQWRGTDPDSLKLTYYKVDVNGFLVERFNDESKLWESYLDFGLFARPSDMSEALGPVEKQQIANQMNQSNLFKAKTEYILIGDEPKGGTGVINLKEMLGDTDYNNIKKLMTYMPRAVLRDWFMSKVWPSLPWKFKYGIVDVFGFRPYASVITDYNESSVQTAPVFDSFYGGYRKKKTIEDMMWAAFIDIFNEANLEYVNEKQIEPWTWEEQKLEAYYLATNKDALTSLENEINRTVEIELALDPNAKAVMEEYAKLPKLGDLGLEINRQNAIKELLKKKEYLIAQAIVDAYRYAKDTVVGETLTKPIPYDIVSGDGVIVKASGG